MCAPTHIQPVSDCGGVIGQSGHCVHVAALLIAAVNVARPSLRDYTAPSTSKLCLWNRPTSGSCYSYLRPICYIPFTHEDINDPSKKGRRACMIPGPVRNVHNPFPSGLSVRTRDDPVMQPRIQAFFDHLKSKRDGKKCGSEV